MPTWMSLTGLAWLTAAFFLWGLFYQLGASWAVWLVALPGNVRARFYPAFRKRWLCPRLLHRKAEAAFWPPRVIPEPSEPEWWLRTQHCRDCHSLLSSIEVLAAEVPESTRVKVRTLGVFFGTPVWPSPPTEKGDEWKGEDRR